MKTIATCSVGISSSGTNIHVHKSSSHVIPCNQQLFLLLCLEFTAYYIYSSISQDQQQLLCFCCCMQEESSYICSSSSLPHQLEFFFIVYSSTKQRTCSPLISYVDVFGSFLVYVFLTSSIFSSLFFFSFHVIIEKMSCCVCFSFFLSVTLINSGEAEHLVETWLTK